MGTDYPSSLGHLDTDAVSIPFEFLTISKIVENDGWIAGKPEPDRGADILARNESDAGHLSVQVKVCAKSTITAKGLEKYQFSVPKTQIDDFHLHSDKSCLVCWMYYPNREPIAAIFPGREIQERTHKEKTAGREYKFHLHLDYEERICRFGVKEKIDEDGVDKNDITNFLDNWKDVFRWNSPRKIRSSQKEKRIRKQTSCIGEMRTIFRILIGDGWTANKPYPDMGSDVIAQNVESGDFCSIQVKTAKESKVMRDGSEKFHYWITKFQREKLNNNSKKSLYIFWIWDQNETEPDDWTPIIISSDELRQHHKAVITGNVNIKRKDGQLFWYHRGDTPAKKWVNNWSYFD
jgi:hypothetical protein